MRKMGTFGSYKCPGFALQAGGTLRRKTFLSSTRGQPCLARSSKQAIVIVDHGSRRAESNKQLEDFVTLYRELYSTDLAVAAHMEIASPSIKEAVAQCVQKGCTEVIVAPYFLSQGRHIQQDIPALVAEAAEEHPDLRCIIADPIGIDKTVADVIHSRVASALARNVE